MNNNSFPPFSYLHHALSGGYWLLCAGDEIYINQCSLIGSIGAIMASFGLEKFIKRHDIERRVLTAGKNKSIMDPFVEMTEAERLRLSAILSDIHEPFKEHVRKSRGNKLIKDEDKLFNGEFWCGQAAVNLD
uniref:Probable protease sohB n=1 Tax=Caligus rogercresseyi TaxID=217165 RepID=C1BNL7_CALRO|nr:Probable protease sohB [Caligus rogercresseyi]